MINAFFGLSESPFSNTPDPKFFFPTSAQNEALNALYRGITGKKGFLVLTGDVGTGKTTLSRTILKMLAGRVDTALVLNSDLSGEEILQTILLDFGVTVDGLTKFELMERLYRYLVDRAAEGRTTLIVIDDAQNLPARSLEQVRMISNFETDKEKLVQILLVGQPELAERLDSHASRQVRQRIAVRRHLEPLREIETENYVMQRLRRAGGEGARNIFTLRALSAIHEETGGYPRLVNTLCDHALTEAYKYRRKSVSHDTIREISLLLGFRQTRRARFVEKFKVLKWHAAAAVTIAAAAVALVAIGPSNIRTGSDAQPDWGRRFAAMEKTLAVVEKKITAIDVTSLPKMEAALSQGELERKLSLAKMDAAGLRGILEQKKQELQVLQKDLVSLKENQSHGGKPVALSVQEAKLRSTIQSLREKGQSKDSEVERIEKELKQLQYELQLKDIKNKEMARDLKQKEELLSAASGASGPPVNLAKIEALKAENDELQAQRALMERMASRTIQTQNDRIERLTLEREKLLKTLKQLKSESGEDLDEETSMLSLPSQ